MYDEASNTPTVCNTQTIFENLGQVNYIFTYKTGTLTENVMRFRKMSVAGIAWRHDISARTKTAARSEHEPPIPIQREVESRQCTKAFPTLRKELPVVTISNMSDHDAVQVHQNSEFTAAHARAATTSLINRQQMIESADEIIERDFGACGIRGYRR